MHTVVDRGDVRVLQTADGDGQIQGGVQLLLGDLGGVNGEGLVVDVGGGGISGSGVGGLLSVAGGLVGLLITGGLLGIAGGVVLAAAAGQQGANHRQGEEQCNESFLHFFFLLKMSSRFS